MVGRERRLARWRMRARVIRFTLGLQITQKGHTMSDRILAESAFCHIINAPIGRIDIADWLFHLPSAEYQRCGPPAHIAAGVSTSGDGIPMPVNVELIGDWLMVHKYVGEVTDAHHCRMVSTSDVFSPLGRTSSHVVWDLSVEPIDAQSCEYINHLRATPTDEFLAFLDQRGVPFQHAAAAHQEASVAHNEKETALCAESLERRALGRRAAAAWRSPWRGVEAARRLKASTPWNGPSATT